MAALCTKAIQPAYTYKEYCVVRRWRCRRLVMRTMVVPVNVASGMLATRAVPNVVGKAVCSSEVSASWNVTSDVAVVSLFVTSWPVVTHSGRHLPLTATFCVLRVFE